MQTMDDWSHEAKLPFAVSDEEWVAICLSVKPHARVRVIHTPSLPPSKIECTDSDSGGLSPCCSTQWCVAQRADDGCIGLVPVELLQHAPHEQPRHSDPKKSGNTNTSTSTLTEGSVEGEEAGRASDAPPTGTQENRLNRERYKHSLHRRDCDWLTRADQHVSRATTLPDPARPRTAADDEERWRTRGARAEALLQELRDATRQHEQRVGDESQQRVNCTTLGAELCDAYVLDDDDDDAVGGAAAALMRTPQSSLRAALKRLSAMQRRLHRLTARVTQAERLLAACTAESAALHVSEDALAAAVHRTITDDAAHTDCTMRIHRDETNSILHGETTHCGGATTPLGAWGPDVWRHVTALDGLTREESTALQEHVARWRRYRAAIAASATHAEQDDAEEARWAQLRAAVRRGDEATAQMSAELSERRAFVARHAALATDVQEQVGILHRMQRLHAQVTTREVK